VNITVTGASGFLGRRLIRRLLHDGHGVHVLGRSRKQELPAAVGFSAWDAMIGPPPLESLERADAVIHLAGESVAQRWNDTVKRRIMDSRRLGTKHLVLALSHLAAKPKVLVSASASGYYGDRGEETLVESSDPGMGFLPEVCIEWEKQAWGAARLGIRLVIIRIGMVLGKDGGALPRMLPAFRMGVAGKLGSGQQWMSWIHVDDLISLFLFAIERSGVSGPVNGVAAEAARNAEFTQALAAAVQRPALLPVPGFALKLLFGEMAEEIMLASQKIVPKAAEEAGFMFGHPELRGALRSLLG
jgi:uncharacterized protein (TIGR01777 family)